jgi:hypothetical protein
MSQKLLYKTKNEIDQKLPRFLKRNFGQGIYISKKREVDDKIYLFSIGNCYPAFFHRPVDKPPVIKFANFKNISTVKVEWSEFDKKFKVTIPSRKNLIDKNKEKYSSIITSVENSLLDTTRLHYVKIPLVQNAMSRIIRILLDLEDYSQINLSHYYKRDREKLLKYLKFLEDMDYVRKENELYVEGNRLNIIKHDLNKLESDRETLFNKILADVLKIGYPYMKKHLRLFQIVPYLRITTSYYYPSYQFEELLSIRKPEFTNFIADYRYSFYNIRSKALNGHPDSKLSKQINDVINSDIFEVKNENIIGNETIFNDFTKSFNY